MPTATTEKVICSSCTESVAYGEGPCPKCGETLLLRGDFLLYDILGQGAHGTTYLAARVDSQEIVAIKEMLVRRANTIKALELFEREARVLESLDHRGVPRFYEDFFEEDGRSSAFFLVQEYIEGDTLAELYGGRPVQVEEVLDVMAELCETLDYFQTYSPPVVHRDIKPENVMRRHRDGSLVLIDFGSVRAVIAEGDGGGSTMAGTFGYMAPEQFLGQTAPTTDVYGVAATGVALLSGCEPHELMNQERKIELRSLNLPGNYADFLQQMLAVDPDQRPWPAEAAAGLRQLLEEGPCSAARSLAPSRPTPSQSPPFELPAPPRSLPANFHREFSGQANRWALIGGLCLVMTAFPVILMIPFFTNGMVRGFELFVPAFFFLFGIINLVLGLTKRRRTARLWRIGRSTPGTIYQVAKSEYTTHNSSSQTYDYHYQYEVDGQPIQGTLSTSSSLSLSEGSPVAVLYDPEAPAKSLMVARPR
jgi:serine/threonine protein kinase